MPVFSQEQKTGFNDNWLLKHSITQIGADGVTRELKFEERMYRRADAVWLERVMSPAAQAAHALSHKSDADSKAHKHEHPPVNVKWISKPDAKSSTARLRLIDAEDKVQVTITPNEFAQVGFEGSWVKAYHLIDPATLKNMKVIGAVAADGTQAYESQQPDSDNKNTNRYSLRVQWDAKAQLPRKVESNDSLGLHRSVTTIEPIAAPSPEPWLAVNSYRVKEYSDYLD